MGNCVQFRAKTDVKNAIFIFTRRNTFTLRRAPSWVQPGLSPVLGVSMQIWTLNKSSSFHGIFPEERGGKCSKIRNKTENLTLGNIPTSLQLKKTCHWLYPQLSQQGAGFPLIVPAVVLLELKRLGFLHQCCGAAQIIISLFYLSFLWFQSASVNVWCPSSRSAGWSRVPHGCWVCTACGPLWPSLCQGTVATSLCPYWSINRFVPYLSRSQEGAWQDQRAIALD